MPNEAERPRRVTVDRDGPILIEGPVDVVGEDGTISTSDRFVVAVCTCRRSRSYPWCDTSHRGHKRPPAAGRRANDRHSGDDQGSGDQSSGNDPKDTHDGDNH
ncbi:CDGSH iron-sulfur domain-containing protein [Streptomyces sp. SP18CS02]|uniref:CDGSH iron-sulfur domain-containing protein n=1 Tax=Streptomyces sp. SP18CS02 TaxID=3002531 RepID=UPI002E7742DE|nr:CDGSH iron-sulfur domain-containing protein [Streptomyces sp. SP18CS02]MEE1752824.1 CDGSH iron-sulfur domain-containing protein [Streptomyces sp. SP18CS02]